MAQHRFTLDDGIRLSFRDEGSGPPVLMLAGLTRNCRDFDYLVRHLHGLRLLRLDSRGRGESDWADPESYNVGQEARDALALLDHLELERAAIIGTSRGGLLAMAMAASAPQRVTGICFNDVGPVLEHAGLSRIGAYVGVPPTVDTLEELADRMPLARPDFRGVPPMRWAEEVVRQYQQGNHCVELPYDPALRVGLDKALAAAPLPEVWPLFDACAHLPLALLRGANSDVLSRATAEAMQARRPDMLYAEVPGRGHVPFLDEPEALALIQAWLARCYPAML